MVLRRSVYVQNILQIVVEIWPKNTIYCGLIGKKIYLTIDLSRYQVVDLECNKKET
jgi:hypothetical protein